MESLEEFYKHKFQRPPKVRNQEIGMFDVFNIEDNIRHNYKTPSYVRRDFYKIMLFDGKNTFHYDDKSKPIKGKTLLFFNPSTPYAYEPLQPDTKGYFCVFKKEFFKGNVRINLNNLPLFEPRAKPVYQLSEKPSAEVTSLFIKMKKEINSDYRYRNELIKSWMAELIFYALKLSPCQVKSQTTDAKTRITSVFMEVLERQFPIRKVSQNIACRTPADFASQLHVHVNYLNRALKETTGKTTSEHIAERLSAEAKILLKHTHWNIAEISYALGYEDQSNFSTFFKRQTNYSPTAFRNI